MTQRNLFFSLSDFSASTPISGVFGLSPVAVRKALCDSGYYRLFLSHFGIEEVVQTYLLEDLDFFIEAYNSLEQAFLANCLARHSACFADGALVVVATVQSQQVNVEVSRAPQLNRHLSYSKHLEVTQDQYVWSWRFAIQTVVQSLDVDYRELCGD
jgi:hypothetical protein